jgi:AbrB family looped-hinge helix DNA binding protein
VKWSLAFLKDGCYFACNAMMHSFKGKTMSKIKVRAGGQIKIPAKIAVKYKLHEGDTLKVRDAGGGILFIPEKVARDKQQRKKLNERLWDQMEQEAEDDIKAGRVAGPFETLEDLLRDLKS